jgi:formylmethanofuran dehydrogenase subunit E
MAGVEERVKAFLEVWEKRKSGDLPSPNLSGSCSACGAIVMGDEYPVVNGEIFCQGCQGSKGV